MDVFVLNPHRLAETTETFSNGSSTVFCSDLTKIVQFHAKNKKSRRQLMDAFTGEPLKFFPEGRKDS